MIENFPYHTEKSTPGFLGPYLELLNSLKNNESPNSSLYDGIKTLKFIYKIYETGEIRTEPK